MLGELGQRIKQSNDFIEKEKNFIKNLEVMRRLMKDTTNGKIKDRLKKDDPEKYNEYTALLEQINKRRQEKEEKQIAELKKLVDDGKIVGIEKDKIKTKLRKKLKRMGLGEDSYTYLEDKNVKGSKTEEKNVKGPSSNSSSADDKEIEQPIAPSSDADNREPSA